MVPERGRKMEIGPMFSHSYSNSNMIVLDRRKFLALAGTLAAAGLLPKQAMALAGLMRSNRAPMTSPSSATARCR
jgi:hypothetical protein